MGSHELHGAPLAYVNSAAVLTQRIAFDPFGQQLSAAGTETPTGNFTGKQRTETVNMFYFGARWQDFETGRFSTIDPILFAPDPQAHNAYSYAINDPVNRTDPDGRCIYDITFIPLGPSRNATRLTSGWEDAEGNGAYTFTLPKSEEGGTQVGNTTGGPGAAGAADAGATIASWAELVYTAGAIAQNRVTQQQRSGLAAVKASFTRAQSRGLRKAITRVIKQSASASSGLGSLATKFGIAGLLLSAVDAYANDDPWAFAKDAAVFGVVAGLVAIGTPLALGGAAAVGVGYFIYDSGIGLAIYNEMR
jgi:RHS repeat-associated protein